MQVCRISGCPLRQQVLLPNFGCQLSWERFGVTTAEIDCLHNLQDKKPWSGANILSFQVQNLEMTISLLQTLARSQRFQNQTVLFPTVWLSNSVLFNDANFCDSVPLQGFVSWSLLNYFITHILQYALKKTTSNISVLDHTLFYQNKLQDPKLLSLLMDRFHGHTCTLPCHFTALYEWILYPYIFFSCISFK